MSDCADSRRIVCRTIEDLSTELGDIGWGDGGKSVGRVDGEEDGGVGEGEFDELIREMSLVVVTRWERGWRTAYPFGSGSACTGDEVEGNERNVLGELVNGHILAESSVEAGWRVRVACRGVRGVSGGSEGWTGGWKARLARKGSN